ncbi:hypothetical protein [Streptosporangium sandarakinum]|uniref:hypothetical protein n=1 Tax=Streptosporangium sandarakinum TaxID=1260955 RepID=UPI0037208FDD
MSVELARVGRGRAEGHTPMCGGGGCVARECLAAEAGALRTHGRDHLIRSVSDPEFCL